MADYWKCEGSGSVMFLTAELYLRPELLCYYAGQQIPVLQVYVYLCESCLWCMLYYNDKCRHRKACKKICSIDCAGYKESILCGPFSSFLFLRPSKLLIVN